jgi:hypothetical protein
MCAQCFITWFAQSPGNGCAACRLLFTDTFVFAHVPKKLHKDYELALARFKFAAEQANMPITRRTIARQFKLDRLRHTIHILYKETNATEGTIRAHKMELCYIHTLEPCAEHTRRYKIERAGIREQTLILRTLKDKSASFLAEYQQVRTDIVADIADPVYCGNVAAACVGILDPESHCDICLYTTCRNCAQSYTGDHQCAAGDVATVKLLRADTKPCPRCRATIHKVSGCDHMWCTQCHVEFDWRTLTISNGGGHNPDRVAYLAQLRQLDSLPEDMMCNVLSAGYRAAYRRPGYHILCRAIIALREKYRQLRPADDNAYAELRRRFLLSGTTHPVTAQVYLPYTEAKYIRDISKIITAARWSQIQSDVLYMFYAGAMSLMGELTVRDTYYELAQLRKLANAELKRASNLFSTMRYKLSKLHDARSLEYMTYAQTLLQNNMPDIIDGPNRSSTPENIRMPENIHIADIL